MLGRVARQLFHKATMSLEIVRDGTTFRPGKSGNRRGPIRSLTPARRALARELGDHAHDIIAITIRLAVAGDAQCCAALVSILAGGFEAPASSKNALAGPGASSAILPAVLNAEVA